MCCACPAIETTLAGTENWDAGEAFRAVYDVALLINCLGHRAIKRVSSGHSFTRGRAVSLGNQQLGSVRHDAIRT